MSGRDVEVAGWLLRQIRRHRLRWLLWLSGVALGAILAALLPILLGRAFDQVWTSGRSALLPLTLLLLGSQLLRALVSMIRLSAATTLGSYIESDIRDEAYASVTEKSATWHSANRTGEVLSRLVNDARQVRALIYPASDVLVNSWGFIVIGMVIAPRYDWSLLVAPVGYLIGYLLISRRFMRTLAVATDRVRTEFGVLNSETSEMLDGLVTVRLSGLYANRLARFTHAAQASRDASVAQGSVEARNPLFLLLGVVQAAGFGQALLLALNDRLSPGSVVGYVGLLLMLGMPTFSALTAYPLAAEGMSAIRRIRRMMLDPAQELNPDGGHRGPVRGALDLLDVSFRYRDSQRPALRRVSASIPPGTLVAVVGATGSGKSTLARLLSGAYPASSGRVLVDGVDIRKWDRAALRAGLAVVPQDVSIFRDTVEGNVTMGRAVSQHALRLSVESAGVDDFVNDLPNGTATLLGAPDGIAVSGGQQQRIGIARAVLGRPGILILDDSTSALDSVTEQRVHRALTDATDGATIVMITSRPALIRSADTVMVLRRGEVVAQGPPAQLTGHSDGYVRTFVKCTD